MDTNNLEQPQGTSITNSHEQSKQRNGAIALSSEMPRDNRAALSSPSLQESDQAGENAFDTGASLIVVDPENGPQQAATTTVELKEPVPPPKDEQEAVIDELNRNYAVAWYGSEHVVIKEEFDPVTWIPAIVITTISDMRKAFADRTIEANGREQNIADFWFRDKRRRKYDKIVFAPEGTSSDNYNRYRGFGVKANPHGCCDLFIQHIRNIIANGDAKVFDYLMNWLAAMVQHPAQRPGVAIALLGDMGVGKGQFVHQIGQLLRQHYLHVSSAGHLTGKFNAQLEDKILVFSDEAYWAGDKAAEGVLKSMITEPTLMIEPKGRNPYPAPNYIWLMLASNNNWVVPAGMRERRFLVLRVSDAHMQDTAYFAQLQAVMDNGGREKLLYELLHRDLSGVDLRVVPQTEALLDNKLQSLKPIQRFWFSKLLQTVPEHWNCKVAKPELRREYREYCASNGIRHTDDNTFGRELGALVPGMGKDGKTSYPTKDGGMRRANAYTFPDLATCRQLFEKAINFQINWDEIE